MRKLGSLLCIIALAVSLGCAKKNNPVQPTIPEVPCGITGVVKDAAGKALAGALVSVSGKTSCTTLADGAFKLTLVPGSYVLDVSKAGFKNGQKVATVVKAKWTTIDISLSAIEVKVETKGTLSGVVKDQSGVPMAGVSITTVQNFAEIAKTAADGSYKATVLAGDYSLSYFKEGYKEVKKTAKVTAGQTSSLDVTLEKIAVVTTGGIEGRVLDKVNNGIVGADIYVNGARSCSTGTNGSFRINEVAPGAVEIAAKKSGYKDASQSITIVVGIWTQVSLKLFPPVGSAYGSITSVDGVMSGVEIYIDSAKVGLSDSLGKYVLNDVAVGTAAITFKANGFVDQTITVQIAEGQSIKTDVIMVKVPNTGTVKGKVTADTGEVLAGVKVSTTSYVLAGTTDASGNYSVVMPIGAQILVFKKDGFQEARGSVTVLKSDTQTLDAVLVNLTGGLGSVEGRVLDQNGFAVPNIDILIDEVKQCSSSTAGSFKVSNLTVGSHKLWVRSSNYADYSTTFSITKNTTTNQTVTLYSAMGILDGYIKDYTGKLVAGAYVYLDSESSYRGSTGQDGHVNIRNIPVGSHNLLIRYTNYKDKIVAVTIAKDAVSSFDVTLDPKPGGVYGTVYDPSIKPLAASDVYVDSQKVFTTDTSGSFRVGNLAMGTHTVLVKNDLMVDSAQEVTVTPNTFASAYIYMKWATGTVAGTVKDPSGAVISNAHVYLDADSYWRWGSLTDGTYSATSVPVGSHTLTFKATNYKDIVQSVAVSKNTTARLDVVLAYGVGTVDGYVYYSGHRICWAKVSVGSSTAVSTNIEGYFKITNVPGGPQTMLVQKAGYKDQTLDVQVTATTSKNITLVPKFTVTYPFYGVNFSAWLDINPDTGGQVWSERVAGYLDSWLPYTQWIHLFGNTAGYEEAAKIAKSRGFKVAAGCWLSADAASNETGIANLIKDIQMGFVDLAVVGCETLYRNDLSESQLIAYIRRVKGYGVQVSTFDTWNELANHPAVIAEVDVVCANIYPYWEGVALDQSVKSLDEHYQTLKALAGTKEVWIGETGWKSAGTSVGSASPSVTNAVTYALNFVSWARACTVKYFYFECYDEPYKGLVDGTWGVMYANGEFKPGMERVFAGETVPDNWNVIGPPYTLELTFVPAIGTSDNLRGIVSGVRTNEYKVVVFIKVGGWWNKPSWASPLTTIWGDRTWVCDITTGGNDSTATEVAAFLVPAGYTPPQLSGDSSLPQVLYDNSLAYKVVTR